MTPSGAPFGRPTPPQAAAGPEHSPDEPVAEIWFGAIVLGILLVLEGIVLLVFLSVGTPIALFVLPIVLIAGVVVAAMFESPDTMTAFGIATLAAIILGLYFSVNPGPWGFLPGAHGTGVGLGTGFGLQIVGVALVMVGLLRLGHLARQSDE